MEGTTSTERLSANISALRKKQGLTQEALAEKLGITFQAVSKWENFLSSPDIQLLPELSVIFGVSLDELFGIPPRERQQETAVSPVTEGEHERLDSSDEEGLLIPWGDDQKLRAVLFKGRQLVRTYSGEEKEFSFEYTGEALHVESFCSITCGPVQGNASAGDYMECGNVGGSANAGNYMKCGSVDGDASAGNYMECGDVGGDATAGSNLHCGKIGGRASAGGGIHCENPNEDASVGGDVL